MGLTFLTFRDLMNDRIPEALISGKVVFIGQTATGVLNADMFEGPFDSQFGVFIQADVADSVIAGEHVRAFPPGAHLALLLLLCTVLGGTLLSVRLQPLLITYPIALVGFLTAALAVFIGYGLLVPVVPAVSAMTLLFAVAIGYGLLRKGAEAQRWEDALGVVNSTGQVAGTLLGFEGGRRRSARTR